MRKSSFRTVPLSLAITALGACSLLNAPEDVRSDSGSGGAGGCTAASDCPRPTQPCRVAFCNADHQCEVQGAADGDACEDGEPCTSGETCTQGLCTGGKPTDCSGSDTECSKGVCTKGIGCGPVSLPEGTPCNTKNTCGTSSCKAGACVVVSLLGNPADPCDDGLFCTDGDRCDENGVCTGGPPKCAQSSPCVNTVCDEANAKCTDMPLADGDFCQDTRTCIGGETCTGQTCGGGTTVKIFFSDDFSADNAKQWTLGTEWEIGVAKASMPDRDGATDPAEDHTATTDNKIAGVGIGKDAAVTPPHPPFYLESPTIDVAAANGKLFLTYYRWLDSDYAPYMRNMVEVFDGMAWHEVWSSGIQPAILDAPTAMPPGAGWTFQSHDITPFKNAALKFRFGFEVANNVLGNQPFPHGSWNIDDVKLQNAPCPK